MLKSNHDATAETSDTLRSPAHRVCHHSESSARTMQGMPACVVWLLVVCVISKKENASPTRESTVGCWRKRSVSAGAHRGTDQRVNPLTEHAHGNLLKKKNPKNSKMISQCLELSAAEAKRREANAQASQDSKALALSIKNRSLQKKYPNKKDKLGFFGFLCMFMLHLFVFALFPPHVVAVSQSCQPPELSTGGLDFSPGGFLDEGWNGKKKNWGRGRKSHVCLVTIGALHPSQWGCVVSGTAKVFPRKFPL